MGHIPGTQIEQKPENFRTMAALQRTMAHLRRIMDKRDIALVNIHKYLWDRFRGVRQDLFVQGFEVSSCPPALCLKHGRGGGQAHWASQMHALPH